jgi:glycosyltransferase involved in cell wall biosynthesis
VLCAPGSVRRFEALLDRFRPDLVHVHELFPLVSPWILPRCARRALPVVMSCVDYRMTCPIVTHLYEGQICTQCATRGEHWALVRNCRNNLAESAAVALHNALVRKLRLFLANVTMFIAPSEFTKGWLATYARVPAERIVSVSPLVEIPDTAVEDASRGEYVGFAGRFAFEKGIHVLVEAARLCPTIPFKLCRNAGSRVTMPTPRGMEVVLTSSRDELNDFYRGSRALAFPSIWFETFGLVGAEAMSHGIPVVASRLGAMTSLLEDGVHGLLFEPGNPLHLAKQVQRLWNDPVLCRELGRAARKRACREWGPTVHLRALLKVYEEALKRSGSQMTN